MRSRSIAILMVCALALAACATPGPPQWKPLPAADLGHPLSLADCLHLALQSDIHSAQWEARMDLVSADLKAARTLPNPSFQASWEDLGIRDAANTALGNSTYGVSYPIFFWLTRGKQVMAAKRRVEAEQSAVQADQRQLRIDVGSAYFSLLAALRAERATAALLDQARESLHLAEESLKLGSASGHDVDLAKTEVLQSESDHFDANQDAQARRLAFAFALGADRPVSIDIVETALHLPAEIEAAAAGTQDLIPDSILDPALDADPVYAEARSKRLATEAQFQLEVRRAIPLSEARAGGAPKMTPDGFGHNLSFEVPIPIFDWNRAGIKRAKAGLLAARTEEEAARRATIATLAQRWQAFRSARTRYSDYSMQIAVNRQRLAVDAHDLFASGRIGYLELIQARSEWRKAERAAADAWLGSMTSAWDILCRIGVNDAATYCVAP